MLRKKFVLVVMGTVMFFLCSISSADVPGMINYQGKLTTPKGGLVNDTVQMTFSVYPDTLGSPAEWTETQMEIVVKDGMFSVLLGGVNPIHAALFDGSVKFLGVQVESDPEMRPLKAMVTTGYAFRSQEADSAEYARAAPPMPDDDWATSGDDIYRLNGNVGIGLTDPEEKLHVAGTSQMTGFKMPTSASSGYVLTSDADGVGTWQEAAASSGDKDWRLRITDTADTTLLTGGAWGIARYGNILHGNADSTHVNLGVTCTTGIGGLSHKYCTVGGGLCNAAGTPYATVGGGYGNAAGGDRATVGGGERNTASGYLSTVCGGRENTATGSKSTVGGGQDNTASGSHNTIAGGYRNTCGDNYSTVGGGRDNTASSNFSTVSGGDVNTASGPASVIGGGDSNIAAGMWGTIGGGYNNMAGYYYSTIGGGQDNNASGWSSTIAGGTENTAGGEWSAVGGGYHNSASGEKSTVGGGGGNVSSSSLSTVAGGGGNASTAGYSAVGGGYGNTASGSSSTVGGGTSNIASGIASTVSGGGGNIASGYASTVCGGQSDTVSGDYSLAVGKQVTVDSLADYTFAFGHNFATSTPHAFILYDADSEIKVGIQTTSPTARLDVNSSTGYGQIRMRTSYTPTATNDPNGNVGDIAWDDNFFYVKTTAGWKRAALTTF